MKTATADAARETRQRVVVTWTRRGRRGPWQGHVRAEIEDAAGRLRTRATVRSERANATLRTVLIWLAANHERWQ